MSFRVFSLVSILAFCAACSQKPFRQEFQITDSITQHNNQRVRNEGFFVLHSEQYFPSDIREIKVDFATFDPKYRFKNEEEARTFFFEHYTKYANAYNDEKQLRPFLSEFPVTNKMLKISFVFLDKKTRQPIPKPFIGRIGNVGSQFYCWKWDPQNKYFVTTHSEQFERALRIYQSNLQKKRSINTE
jgi:hypothetical protein